ncbi:MAG: hypothetical protein PHF56_21585 [Desulfuromonadaceae bacterium]|nr:hypothetical protein [Desulfuromonadaceae bacterium]
MKVNIRGKVRMGDQLYLERFVWLDHEALKERYPNAFKRGDHFEIPVKTTQRSINHFCDRLLTPLESVLVGVVFHTSYVLK